jgi:hypothetical protein
VQVAWPCVRLTMTQVCPRVGQTAGCAREGGTYDSNTRTVGKRTLGPLEHAIAARGPHCPRLSPSSSSRKLLEQQLEPAGRVVAKDAQK